MLPRHPPALGEAPKPENPLKSLQELQASPVKPCLVQCPVLADVPRLSAALTMTNNLVLFTQAPTPAPIPMLGFQMENSAEFPTLLGQGGFVAQQVGVVLSQLYKLRVVNGR